MLKKLFGYIRVSTVKQGERGVSLQEQRDAIVRYAERNGFEIIGWFEERETAAKRGRPVFNQMLKLLKQGKAHGVIIHKIDRSARNLKDWADLGELIDQGIEVHFANESLDLHSRGGRLSADIQAVVAADYIRNLREETRKGFYGRIKQGVYPLPAPLGYLDMGKGKPKELDPMRAPLVRKAFELYGSGRYNLDDLVLEMYRLGLRNRNGGKVTRTGLSVLLNNPFYIGLIRLRRTGETFVGSHQPLIAKSLFDRVRKILDGRLNTRSRKHDVLFRRMITCKLCGYSLIGETQKGHVYYRCHTKDCPTACVREETVETEILETFEPLRLHEDERKYVALKVQRLKEDWGEQKEAEIQAVNLSLGQIQDRLSRLTDAYIDRMIEKDIFEQRKAALLMERKGLEEKLAALTNEAKSVPDRLVEFLELAGDAYLQYKLGLPEEKRDLLTIATSNREVSAKNVDVTLAQPFCEVANRFEISNSAPERSRTLEVISIVCVMNEPLSEGGFLDPSGKFACLPRRTLADYGVGYATYRRGTGRIPCDLETGVQGRPCAWRSAALRLATHRAVCPARQTSAVGEEVVCIA
jgi:DNA invertase Pin-like site-specific DNA recombinase